MNIKLALLVVLAIGISAALGDGETGDNERQLDVGHWIDKFKDFFG
uniref:Uncharacterized protein n=1 Tax=Anopheles albimanus TaxID=7167 RepID=A0A182FWY5_ANOAL